ncbi:single-stranded DNA-binding protein [Prauserella halophila]|uniref:Single-stranded DNA-binding protein n=1 Tax=Prauserella halophila TaxID=185641 RepID=A0ABN1WJM0_9PSEU|nr:R3H domain-containing nucleic acid-binding protein [Prauserella halophila]MCP2236658.1 spoIIIJ-associated protein [Prauserella halophila]
MSETAEVIGTEEEKAAASGAGDETAGDSPETGAADSADAPESGEETSGDERSGESDLVREGDIAGDYLERLLDLLDYDGDIDLDVEAGRAIVSIEGGDDLEKLVGSRGNVLEALQELTRLAVQQETGSRSRLMLDVAGWRAGRREELRRIGRTAGENVAKSGEKEKLQPMSPFERKVVHDAVAEVEGVTSESEGEEPKRRVVVVPE